MVKTVGSEPNFDSKDEAALGDCDGMDLRSKRASPGPTPAMTMPSAVFRTMLVHASIPPQRD